MRVIHAASSHVGLKRLENQDRVIILPHMAGAVGSASWRLLAVADGMGGEAAGGLAAQTAMDELELLDGAELCQAAVPQALASWARQVNDALLRMGRSIPDLEGMGSTLTTVLLCGKTAHWLHVGDSRLYLLRGRALRQVTKDHRFLQSMLEDGSIDPSKAATHPLRNRLDQCLGCRQFNPDTGSFSLRTRDVLLLCSDGLHDEAPETIITTILNSLPASPREPDLEDVAQALIEMALRQGGRDNVSVVLACVQD
ncbi:PP2C family protein-serine/threonine phosphatase [Megalodesulfovibrio paquesii]